MIKKKISPHTLELIDMHFAKTGDCLSDLGVISLLDTFGYLYLVPLKEKFYQQSNLAVDQIAFLSENVINVPSDNTVFSKMTAENWMLTVLTVCNASVLWILDIGAFIGAFSLQFSSVAKKVSRPSQSTKLFVFEPNPLNINLLKANLSLNKISSEIEVVQTACSSYNGRNKFVCWNKARIGGKILDSEDHLKPGAIVHIVDASRVDNFLDKYAIPEDDVFCVKIDTEGCESAVMAGFGRYLQQICLCILEYWPDTGKLLVDGVPFAEYLVNNFEILMMGNSLFSRPLPWKIISSADELNSYAELSLKERKNVDIACVNNRHPLRDDLISALT